MKRTSLPLCCVPQAVLEVADVSAVTQLILRERLSCDLGLWEQLACKVAFNRFGGFRGHWQRVASRPRAVAHGRPSRSLTFCGGLAELNDGELPAVRQREGNFLVLPPSDRAHRLHIRP